MRHVFDMPSSLVAIVANLDNCHGFGLVQQRKRVLERTTRFAVILPADKNSLRLQCVDSGRDD